MTRPLPTEAVLLRGPDGDIEALLDMPAQVRGIALLCHPHPLFGGSNTNKVVHTLARSLRDRGYVSIRPNFRGVGKSEGEHDQGIAETLDMLAVLSWAQSRWGVLPILLGGFSFGGFVQVQVARHLAQTMTPAQRIVLVGLACGEAADGSRHYETLPLPPQEELALVVHGESDQVVALQNVLDWARPQSQPVVVVGGADHFFHGKLTVLRDIVLQNVTELA